MRNLKYAIKMENEGEKYYLDQARINSENSLHQVCLMLAKDEGNHARILNLKLNDEAFNLPKSDSLSKTKTIFAQLRDFQTDAKETAKQLDFYRMASELEKRSIDLYSGFLDSALDVPEKKLFEYLVKQEKQHFEVLDELASQLRNAEEWVESAEFGVRKPY
jgi:rubrerythrin